MKAPQGIVVVMTGNIPFTGILNRPTTEPTSIATAAGVANVLSVASFSNDQSTPIFFQDVSGNPLNVELRIPVSGGVN
jgi:hypothetical protein